MPNNEILHSFDGHHVICSGFDSAWARMGAHYFRWPGVNY